MTADIRDVAPPERLLRLTEVCHRVGLGKTSIYEMMGRGLFPKPLRVTSTAVRWSEREIAAWIHTLLEDHKVGIDASRLVTLGES